MALDLFFATLGASVTLVMPLIVRYITGTVIYEESGAAWQTIVRLSVLMLVLLLVELGCNFYITYWGHLMGARMEYGMRNDIFGHYQKLAFTFYDNQKVGQLMSRVTNDLFDITELLHHGPEDIIISLIKIVGALVILGHINMRLTILTACFLPFILAFALYLNKRMKRVFKENRVKMADINGQIEDNLSGIRVVKSFANEDIEMRKFKKGNERFLATKRRSAAELDSYISRMYGLEDGDRVFPFTRNALEYAMQQACEKSGVKKIRIHDLRHSHASLLIEMGFSPVLIAERLGHESVETTLNTYSHLYPNKQAELADRLELENEEDKL